jgi:cell wall-associated NlpC family hydrolase
VPLRLPYHRRILVALACAVIAACIGAPKHPDEGPQVVPPVTQPSGPASETRMRIVFTAMQMVGVPYRYGGESPEGFDCSGLVQYAYRTAGLSVPRTAQEQLGASRAIPLADAAPGDLLFFHSRTNDHVAIYLGQGRFIHAPATSRNVALASMNDDYYRRHFVRAGRLPALDTRTTADNR